MTEESTQTVGSPRLQQLVRYRTPLLLTLLGILFSVLAYQWASGNRAAYLRAEFEQLVEHNIVTIETNLAEMRAIAKLLRNALKHSPETDAEYVEKLLEVPRSTNHLVSFQWWYKSQPRYKDQHAPLDKGVEFLRREIMQPSTEPARYFSKASVDNTRKRAVFGIVRRDPIDPDHLFLSEYDLTRFMQSQFKTAEASAIGGIAVYHQTQLEEPLYLQNSAAFAAAKNKKKGSMAKLSFKQLLADENNSAYQPIVVERFLLRYVFIPAKNNRLANERAQPPLILFLSLCIIGIAALLSFGTVVENLRISDQVNRRTKQLRESEERSQLIIDAAALGIWDYNVVTSEVFSSARMKEMLALQTGNVSQPYRDLTNLIHPDDRGNFTRKLAELETHRKPISMQCKVFRKSGGHFWANITANAKWDDSGKLVRIVGAIDDISGMRTAQKELERSNKELDDFAYIASHDLKEPLRGIFNHTKFLEEDYAEVLKDDGRKRIARMQFLVKRMEKLITDLLYFSRLGRAEEKPETTDLNVLVKEVSDLYADENTIIDIVGRLPTVSKDRQRLSNLFRNLIGNAVKYNTNELKQIVVGVMPMADGDLEPTLYVEDNGIGIDKKFYVDIFKIFKRLHHADKYAEGTGSGLTFAKKIVEEWGGKIWLLSKIGEGTTFYFTLGSQSKDHSAAKQPLGTE